MIDQAIEQMKDQTNRETHRAMYKKNEKCLRLAVVNQSEEQPEA